MTKVAEHQAGTKVSVRLLPPELQEDHFRLSIDSKYHSRITSFYYAPGAVATRTRLRRHPHARIQLESREWAHRFERSYHGHVFQNEKGEKYRAVACPAPNQRSANYQAEELVEEIAADEAWILKKEHEANAGSAKSGGKAKGKSSSRGKSSKDRFGSGFGSSSAGASTTTVLSSRDQRKLSRAKEELRIKKLQLALLDRRYTWTKTIKDAESVALLKSKALNARMDEYESVTVTDSALFKYWKDLQAHKKLVLQITRENQGSGIAVDDFGYEYEKERKQVPSEPRCPIRARLTPAGETEVSCDPQHTPLLDAIREEKRAERAGRRNRRYNDRYKTYSSTKRGRGGGDFRGGELGAIGEDDEYDDYDEYDAPAWSTYTTEHDPDYDRSSSLTSWGMQRGRNASRGGPSGAKGAGAAGKGAKGKGKMGQKSSSEKGKHSTDATTSRGSKGEPSSRTPPAAGKELSPAKNREVEEEEPAKIVRTTCRCCGVRRRCKKDTATNKFYCKKCCLSWEGEGDQEPVVQQTEAKEEEEYEDRKARKKRERRERGGRNRKHRGDWAEGDWGEGAFPLGSEWDGKTEKEEEAGAEKSWREKRGEKEKREGPRWEEKRGEDFEEEGDKELLKKAEKREKKARKKTKEAEEDAEYASKKESKKTLWRVKEKYAEEEPADEKVKKRKESEPTPTRRGEKTSKKEKRGEIRVDPKDGSRRMEGKCQACKVFRRLREDTESGKFYCGPCWKDFLADE